MDKAVEEGQFEAASELSDRLAEREVLKGRACPFMFSVFVIFNTLQLACKIATAFDCHRFAQKHKVWDFASVCITMSTKQYLYRRVSNMFPLFVGWQWEKDSKETCFKMEVQELYIFPSLVF